ncbi:MAG: hypothetical protein EPO11_00130, partial [Gammaproteobacteria bacterium]
MKLKLIASCAIISSTLLLAGCADMQAAIDNGSAVSTSDVQLEPTNPNKVKIYYGNQNIPKHAKIIGQVSADHHNVIAVPCSQTCIAKELKKQAASIGGTGVI